MNEGLHTGSDRSRFLTSGAKITKKEIKNIRNQIKNHKNTFILNHQNTSPPAELKPDKLYLTLPSVFSLFAFLTCDSNS